MRRVKVPLSAAPVQTHLDPDQQLVVQRDASLDGLDAVLPHVSRPMGYASRPLTA